MQNIDVNNLTPEKEEELVAVMATVLDQVLTELNRIIELDITTEDTKPEDIVRAALDNVADKYQQTSYYFELRKY